MYLQRVLPPQQRKKGEGGGQEQVLIFTVANPTRTEVTVAVARRKEREYFYETLLDQNVLNKTAIKEVQEDGNRQLL